MNLLVVFMHLGEREGGRGGGGGQGEVRSGNLFWAEIERVRDRVRFAWYSIANLSEYGKSLL